MMTKALLLAASALALLAGAAQAQTPPGPFPTTPQAQQVEPGRYWVFFDFDRSTLRADARRVVAEAAASFQRTGATVIELVGSADNTGSREYNQRLSERRARAVQDELVRQGVPAGIIQYRGVSFEAPIADNTRGARQPLNRYVAIVFPERERPPATAAPAPSPAPAPEAPAPTPRWAFTIGGFYGFNLEDEGDSSKESHLPGAELGIEYLAGDNVVIGLNYAGFHAIQAEDNGYGGRGVASLDLAGNFAGARPYVGLNAGYIYGNSVNDGFLAGPEVGARVDLSERSFLYARVAYDFLFDNGWDDGVINGGLGVGFRF
jgi:outer membrane protein OmpA-like peptidoglycan-associated protein